MKVYAERPARITRQIIADLAITGWAALWIWIAVTLYYLISKLATPGVKLESAGDQLATNLDEAQQRADSVPLIGGKLSEPFGSAADAARTIAEAGRTGQDAVGDLATTLAWLVAGVPILLALMLWVPIRMTWIGTATAAAKLRSRPGGTDLLALRAIATAPLRKLVDLDADCVTAWRNGDQSAIDYLARVELKRLGLRN